MSLSTRSIPEPDPLEPVGRSCKLPRPLWLFLATLALVVVSLGLIFGWPMFRQRSAINAVENAGGVLETRRDGPEWLRGWIGNDPMRVFDEIRSVEVNGANYGDADLSWLRGQPRLVNLLTLPDSMSGL
ncbi:MAG: hypothetical protein EXS05_24010 [Planctomycetaceae bacterium]|nr:hypothetical protein [Planctomycetaceae bacterium]